MFDIGNEHWLRLHVAIAELERQAAVRHVVATVADGPMMLGIRREVAGVGDRAAHRLSVHDVVARYVDLVRQREPFGPALPDWHRKGFATPPKVVRARAGTRLYRVWGGGSGEQGRWFGFKRPSNVTEAELMFNVAALQFLKTGDPKEVLPNLRGLAAGTQAENLIRRLTVFEAAAGTLMWVGPLAHGPSDRRIPMQQAYIDFPHAGKVRIVSSGEPLKQDAAVVGAAGRSRMEH